jgi:hypothetical protein
VSLGINGGLSSFSIHEQSYGNIAPDLIALHSSKEDTSGEGSTPSRQLSSPSSTIRRVALDRQFPMSFSIPAVPSRDRVHANLSRIGALSVTTTASGKSRSKTSNSTRNAHVLYEEGGILSGIVRDRQSRDRGCVHGARAGRNAGKGLYCGQD